MRRADATDNREKRVRGNDANGYAGAEVGESIEDPEAQKTGKEQ
jgi:hypothetical protein